MRKRKPLRNQMRPSDSRRRELDGFEVLSRWLEDNQKRRAKGAEKAILSAFDSREMKGLLDQLKGEAREHRIRPEVVESVWATLRNDAVNRARKGDAYNWSFHSVNTTLALTNLNIGELAVLPQPPMMLALQGGIPIILADAAGGTAIEPTSTLGKAITVLDIILEILGALLLLVNVVMPKFNWARVIEVVGSRKNIDALQGLAGLIAVLGKMISEEQPMEKILELAIKILRTAFGLEGAGGGIYEVFKKGFDIGFWDWIELLAKFALLWALEAGADTLSAGAATAAKVALVGATIGDVIFKKVPRLTGGE